MVVDNLVVLGSLAYILISLDLSSLYIAVCMPVTLACSGSKRQEKLQIPPEFIYCCCGLVTISASALRDLSEEIEPYLSSEKQNDL